MSSVKGKLFIIFLFIFFTLVFTHSQKTAEAYYGGYGLYGIGGLYGLSSSYGIGGLYGLGSLYGMSGLYGLGGLYGGYSPFGLQNMYYNIGTGTGLNYQVPFLQIAPLLGVAGLYNSLFPSLFNTAPSATVAPISAEQVGTWQGLWTSSFTAGPITLNLIEDPLLGNLTGYVQLVANPVSSAIINVVGTVLNSQIILDGISTNGIQIIGTLISPTNMIGTYAFIGSGASDNGTFEASLLTPTI